MSEKNLSSKEIVMCDVKKYEQLYQEIEKLKPEDTLQLVLESETEDQREFYQVVGDFLLQKKQREVIERNLFRWKKIYIDSWRCML